MTQWNHFIAPYVKSTVMAGIEVGGSARTLMQGMVNFLAVACLKSVDGGAVWSDAVTR